MTIVDGKLIPSNIGCAFMMIKQKSFAKLLFSGKAFINNKNIHVPMSLYESQRYQFHNWRMEPAYFQNDILWDGLNFNLMSGNVGNIIQFVLLFVVSVILVTPVSLYSVVTPISDSLSSQEGSVWSSLGHAIQSNSSPLIIALCNVIIIPFLVDRVAEI